MNNGPLEQSSSTGDDPPAPGRPRLLLEMLPSEVLAETIEYLSNDDLLNLPYRVLKNGLLKAEGLRRFRQHRVWMDKKDLYRLARISNHPIIRQYVEELVFYLDKPREPDKFDLRGRNRSLYLAYKKTSDDLQKLTEDGTDIRILVMAFTSLPNANTVTIDNIDRLLEERYELGAAVPVEDQIYHGEYKFHGDHGTYLLTLLVKALAASPVKPATLQVISAATPAITRPDLRFFYNGGPRTAISLAGSLYTVPSSAYPAAFGEMKKLDLRDLRRTQLEYSHSYFGRNGRELGRVLGPFTEPLERIVKSAVSISDLTIGHTTKGISDIRSECMLDIQLSSLLEPGGHPHLRRLELAELVTQQWHMVGSLQACAPALTDLTLGTIHLNQGTWARTFDNLKGLFKLERLELGKLDMSGADCKDETGRDKFHDVVGSDDSDNILGWLCGTIENNPYRPGRNL